MQKNKYTDGLGRVIKSARTEKRLTQKQLAERLSITPHYLKAIENKRKIPSCELLFRIVWELEIPADTIFYPEHKQDHALLQKLQMLLKKCDDGDIAVITATLQSLLQTKNPMGGEVYAAFHE